MIVQSTGAGRLRPKSWGLIAIGTLVAASFLVGAVAALTLLQREDSRLGGGLSNLRHRAYVLVQPSGHAPNQLVAIDFIQRAAPVVTPVPLSLSGGPLSGPHAIAVTEDDSRLFAISLIDEGDVPDPRYRLSVVDPVAPASDLGTAVITDYFDQIGGATFPPLAASADGSFVYILGHSSIQTYDVQAKALLPEAVSVPNCGPANLVPLADPHELGVLCHQSQEIHLLRIGDSGRAVDDVSVTFPVVPDDRKDSFGNPFRLGNAHWAVASPDKTKIWVVSGNGHVFGVDAQSGAIAKVADLGLSPQEWVRYSHGSLSADGATMLLGLQDVSSLRGGSDSETIMVVDTASWTPIARVRVDRSLEWLALDDTGNIYAAADNASKLIVVDRDALAAERRTVSLEGEPVQLVVVR